MAIVGLPRSGTTLLTTLLDRHPAFCLYYEPWNASARRRPPVPASLVEFRDWMHGRFGGSKPGESLITGFKETTTNQGTIDWAVSSASALSKDCAVKVIWIQREPIHCLLSKVEGAKKWWGHDDAKMTREALEQFLRDAREQCRRLDRLVREVGGLLVRYESLASEPVETLSLLMESLGVEFDPVQLAFHRQEIDREKVMGDPGLIESPSPVSMASTERRRAEAERHRALIDSVLADPEFASMLEDLEAFAPQRAVTPIRPYFEP